LALVVACATTSAPPPSAPQEIRVEPPTASPPASSVAPPASPATQSSSAAEKPRHPAGGEHEDAPPPPPAIGDSCADVPQNCGKSGKVAIIRERLRAHKGVPCTPVPISPPHAMPNRVSACIDGERVFVTSSCIVCRIMTEDRLLALVSDMTPAQLEEAQALAALPKSPALTTVAAWKSAIDARRKASQP
jgi:hypothetical protein